jgi:colanic acid biosynthesis glycosyl transferase WcaI
LRILIAGANYAPESTSVAPFTTGLAEHLAKRGHEVVVATTFAFYPLWKWYEPPTRWRTREQLNGVDVWRTKIVLPPRRTAIWRVAFDTSIALTTALTALSVPKADVTICLSPPVQTTLVGAALRFKFGKLVMLVKDLPTEAARSVGMLQEGSMLRVGRAVERVAYKAASHIVVISNAFATYIRSLGVEDARISEIPDWVDVETIQPADPDQKMRSRLGAGPGDFLVLHSGNMGAKQDLLNVVAAATLLRNERRIRIALIGDGTERTKIAEAVSAQHIENLKLLPLQPSNEFPNVLAAADVLLVNQAPMVVDSVLPSKLLAYMASGRPVLAAAHTQSTTAELVRRSSCGVVAEPGRPAALAAAITAMARGLHELGGMGRQGRVYVEAHFERNTVLRRWDDLLAELMGD